MWTEEYRPTDRAHYIDSSKHYRSLKNWIKSTIAGVSMKNKYALLSGYSGTGKTSLVKLLADELGLNLIIRNSSESMLKGDVEDLYRMVVTTDLTGKRVLLLDEVDGVRKTSQDKLSKMCRKAKIPIIMICNDKYQLSPSLRFGGFDLSFRRPTKTQIRSLLKTVVKRAKLDVTAQVLESIVNNTSDYRSALNTLEMAHNADTCEISDLFSREDNELSPFELCQRVLDGKRPEIGMNPHLFNFWIFESTRDKATCAAIDTNLARESETRYRSWFYAYRLFHCLTPSGRRIKFPAKFKKRSAPRRNVRKKSKQTKKKAPKKPAKLPTPEKPTKRSKALF